MATEKASESNAGGRPSRTVWLALAGVAFLIGCAVGAYFVGKSVADAPRAREQGRAEGAAVVRAQYEPGEPRYARIFAAGRAQGERAGQRAGRQAGERAGERAGRQAGEQAGERAGERIGFTRGELEGERAGLQRGERQGELTGDRAGIASGARAALGGFASWDVGSLYVVTVARGGRQGVPWVISSRQDMRRGQAYRTCTTNPEELCTIKLPPS